MGSKHLVVVEPRFLAGAVATRSVGEVGEVNVPAVSMLASRRALLTQLAETLLGTHHAVGDEAMVSLMTSGASPGPLGASLPTQVGRYDVLESLGAFVVDEDDVDVPSLDQVFGLTTIADQELQQPSVTAAATTQQPDSWHRSQVGWEANAPAGNGVLVGVLDTGIDDTHPEFAGKAVHFQKFDGVGRRLSSVAHDVGSHGTHVCGLIAGRACGIAPDSDLAVASVLTTPGPDGLTGGLVQVANGLNWLLTHPFRPDVPGVDVVNASLAGSGFNPFLQGLLQNALIAPGVLMIASIGNNGVQGIDNHGSPGNYKESLGVGAVDGQDVVADFSDWGTLAPNLVRYSKPDFSAPGVDVCSSVPGGSYRYMSGTSMAAPIACGVAAVLLQKNPGWLGSPNLLRSGLMTAATAPILANPAGNLGGTGRIAL